MSRENVDSNYDNRRNKMNQTSGKTTSTNEFNLLHYITSLYGNTLSARGLNLLDPLYTNMFYYNKMRSKPLTDMPYVSRTYAFFTRPELNFSYENINAIPFFKWLYSKPIGKMVMSMLTDPEYFINAPSVFNNNLGNTNLLKSLLKTYNENLQAQNNSMGEKYDTESVPSGIGESTSTEEGDDAAALAELQALDLDSLNDDAAIENILKSGIVDAVKGLYGKYDQKVQELYGKMNAVSFDDVVKDKDFVTQAKYIMRKTHNSAYDNFNFTSPFIPLLMNTCTNLNGAKDLNLQTYEYEEDEFSIKQNVATGMDDIWAPGTITVSHEDIAYGPVSLLYMLWIFYIHYVSRGYIMSTRQHITERILDYTCSIYVFVIGGDGCTIERFGKFTGCYPTSFPLSQQLEHNQEIDPAMLQKIQVTFQYNSYEPMNPEIFTDFNFVSETEWLFKLKNWDTLYNRNDTLLKEAFLDYYSGKMNRLSETAKQTLHKAGRHESIWETVSNPGMSGKVPRALINGTAISGLADFSRSDLTSDIWGGYPAIINGKELIWVMPKWDDTSAKHDRGFNGQDEVDDV